MAEREIRDEEIGLNNLRPVEGSRKARKRIGRGEGSRGKTSGRGHKGYGSRAGSKEKAGREGDDQHDSDATPAETGTGEGETS